MKTSIFSFNAVCRLLLSSAALIGSVAANAQSGTGGGSSNLSNGLKFENFSLTAGNDLEVGAEYRFAAVNDTTDAIVRIDSLINGAKVNKIDDNSSGTGYKTAFQPAVQSGNTTGRSYAVFTFRFVGKNTNTPVLLQEVNATALDLDGNNSLKEFARIRIGNGGKMAYMSTTSDITVAKTNTTDFQGENILGVERNGIDTASYNNMFTASNTGISSFSVAYGTVKTTSSATVRQYSLYLKGFYYPASTLPVKLSSFTAMLVKNTVNLAWVSAQEINVSHFEVERSTDGVNFSQAGLVFAYGSASDKASYQFNDNVTGIQHPVIYYRLRAVDADGKNDYSETRIIRIAPAQQLISLQTFPNPVMNELRVSLPVDWQNKQITIEILRANGQVAGRQVADGRSQTETINMSNLSSGFYIVKASCAGQTAQQKIIKH